MTSFFDDYNREVSAAAETEMPDKAFLFFIAYLEREMIPKINLVTGDREFPEELREKIQGLIAMNRTTSVGDIKARQQALDEATLGRTCPLVTELHRAFHVVGSRRIKTRFGVLSDNPDVNLAMRADHDGDNDES